MPTSENVTTVSSVITKFLKLVRSTISGGASPFSAAPFLQNQIDAPLLLAPPTVTVASNLLSPPATVTGLTSVLSSNRGTAFANPLSPLLKSVNVARADQGFCLRWVVPGVGATSETIIGTFHFGQYALVIWGNGTITLLEDVNFVASSGTSPDHRVVYTFRYSPPNSVSNNPHSLIIYPVLGPNGEKYINFASAYLDALQTVGAGIMSVPSGSQNKTGAHTNTECFYRWDEAVNGTADQSGASHVTVSAVFWLQETYGLRCHWQVSKLGFWAAGHLIDQPWDGEFEHPSTDYLLSRVEHIPAGSSISTVLKDAKTLATTPIIYPFVRFDFNSATDDTPRLWGYRLARQPLSLVVTPGQFTAPFVSMSLSGAAADPRAETGNMLVRDAANVAPRLGIRTEFAAKIETTFTHPIDGLQTVKLFRGYVTDSYATQQGVVTDTPGGFGGSVATANVYPAPRWNDYALTFGGMWLRLSETNNRTMLSYEYFTTDESAAGDANGMKPPWKVTDAIRYMIRAAGFPLTMINIPDISIRLYRGILSGASDQLLDQHTNIAARCIMLARNYLGRCLAFDPNAGTEGQWILLAPPPPGTITPVHNFVEGTDHAPVAGQALLPHMESAFSANTTFALKPVQHRIKKPEYNHLWGLCVLQAGDGGSIKLDQHVHNYLSYKVPNSTIDPDPNSPHYLGREKTALIGDPTLWAGAASGDYAKSQGYIDFVMMRYFIASCMARETINFTARLAFIKDAATVKYRPLRYYDVVTWRGQSGWFVRSVNISYSSDRLQLAKYELERIVPYLAPAG